MARENFTPKVKREITNYSAGACMICKKKLNSPEIAHIIPASEKGPRSKYRNSYSQEFIKSPENGLCLCNYCHELIDDDGLNKYTVEDLLQINRKFKKDYFISEEYKHLLGINDINNSNELIKFYNHLLNLLNMNDEESNELLEKNEGFVKICIDEKIEKNDLHFRQARLIREKYAFEFFVFKETIENSTIISEKIKSAIKILYHRIKTTDTKMSNADIFDKMLTLMYDPSNQVVGNKTPLIYFFIICEVFSI